MSKITVGHRVNRIDNSYINDRIIFRQIEMSLGTDGKLNIYYNDHDKPLDENINDFIDKKKKYVDETARPIVEGSPLDLNCHEDYFIVFYLSGKWNWQFSTKSETGFSTKENHHGRYCNLMHVMKDKEPFAGRLHDDGCRLLFFRAKCSSAHYHHGFNLHVDLLLPKGGTNNEDQRTTIIIDPEVKHPQGSGG